MKRDCRIAGRGELRMDANKAINVILSTPKTVIDSIDIDLRERLIARLTKNIAVKSLNDIADEISNILKKNAVSCEFYTNENGSCVLGFRRQVGNRIERFMPIEKENGVFSNSEFTITEEIV
jgi:hypothetical protein